MCISVFAVIERGGKVLMGVPRGEKRWTQEWITGWASYTKEDRSEALREWRLPSCYLREGEHPDDAVLRVMRDQLGLTTFDLSSARVMSYATPSDWYPGNEHWDLVFVYNAKVRGEVARPSWWSQLRFLGRSELRGLDLGWNDDLMRDLQLVG